MIGTSKISFEGDGNDKQIIKAFSFWSSLPKKCGNCGSSDISLSYRSPKGFEFFGLECAGCKYNLSFGQYKDGNGLFVKGTWESPYGEQNDKSVQTAKKVFNSDSRDEPPTDWL